MALIAQKTTVWKARIEHFFDLLSVYKDALTNNHYEGELTSNATLKIVSIDNVAVSDYTGAWLDADVPSLATTNQEFTLDQKKKIIFKVSRTDQQGSGEYNLIDEGSKRVAVAINTARDSYLASFHSDITSNVYGDDGTPITVGFDSTAGEILPSVALSELIALMGAANADMSEPRCVVPAWFGSYLYQEIGTKFTGAGDQASTFGAVPGKMQGLAGNAGGFSGIWISNNVANTGSAKYKVMACGAPGVGITTASVIDQFDIVPMQNDFADLAKGLYVYGALVPFEQHMALGTFNKGTARR